jgi:hypothetical protein
MVKGITGALAEASPYVFTSERGPMSAFGTLFERAPGPSIAQPADPELKAAERCGRGQADFLS